MTRRRPLASALVPALVLACCTSAHATFIPTPFAYPNTWRALNTFSLNAAINNGTASAPSFGNTPLAVIGADGKNANIQVFPYGGAGNIFINRADGTSATPTAVQNGDTIFSLEGDGYAPSNPYASGAGIICQASQAFTGTAQGIVCSAIGTPNGSTLQQNAISWTGALVTSLVEHAFSAAEDHAIVTKMASFSFDATLHNVAVGSRATPLTGAVVATLPACVTAILGRTYGLKKVDTSSFAATLSAASTNAQTGVADAIDGAATVGLTAQYAQVNVQCDGAGDWWRGFY